MSVTWRRVFSQVGCSKRGGYTLQEVIDELATSLDDYTTYLHQQSRIVKQSKICLVSVIWGQWKYLFYNFKAIVLIHGSMVCCGVWDYCTHNVINCTRLRLVQLPSALHMLIIPNTTANHATTYQLTDETEGSTGVNLTGSKGLIV